MDATVLVTTLSLSAGFAAALLAFFAVGMAEELRARRLGAEPRPGLRACNDFVGSVGILFAVATAVQLAWLSPALPGPWRWVSLLAANVLVQPLSLLFAAGGCYQTWQGLRGRLTYTFRVIGRDCMPAERYKELVAHRRVSGVLLVAFAIGLSCACLCPAL
jgi:hypothetical protein